MSMQAFPSAYGWGAQTIGGRGGTVVEVTTLDDDGGTAIPGSFRDAMKQTFPRIIVFRVGGTINMVRKMVMRAENSDFTVAGQTAPGEGITVALSSDIEFNNVDQGIMRYLRFRHDGVSVGQDCIEYFNECSNHILDHCSFSWSTDEILSAVQRSQNITFQWCIISENTKPNHNMASLISEEARGISIHHSLFAHVAERNPKIFTQFSELPVGERAYYEFVNNVVYNWQKSGTDVVGAAEINAINNYYKAGFLTLNPDLHSEINWGLGVNHGKLYAAGNIGPHNSDPDANNWDAGMIRMLDGTIMSKTNPTYMAVPVQVSADPIPTTSAAQAFEDVLADVGASKLLNEDGTWRDARDSVDARIVADVRAGTGDYISDISEVGGIPEFTGGIPYVDDDGDGMPDMWELAQGFDPNDPSDGSTIGPSGYSNVELFLNGTVGGGIMSVVDDLIAVEAALRAEATELIAQADAVAQAVVDLQAVDDVFDAAADVIEED